MDLLSQECLFIIDGMITVSQKSTIHEEYAEE